MSKEAAGSSGGILGGAEYWSGINRSAFFGGLLRQASEINYHEALREIGNRAGGAVEEIYGDLQDHIKQVRTIPSDRRSALAKQVRALYDVCRMAGGACPHHGECISILNLSDFFTWSSPPGDEQAVQAALAKIKNNGDYFASEGFALVKKAAEWGIPFAAGGDKKKQAFLEDVAQGGGRDFLRAAAQAYQSSGGSADIRGRCGCAIGGSDYLEHFERDVFRQEVPTMHSARWGSPNYAGLLKESLEAIANQLEWDLDRNERENNYLTDETARDLKNAVSELKRCGVGAGSLDSKIEKLAWFVGGDPAKIRQLQSALNQLGMGERLEEDGVYGKKTLAAWGNFLNRLEHGAVPTLAWIDPLKTTKFPWSEETLPALSIGDSASGINNTIKNAKTNFQYFRVDSPHISPKGAVQNGYYRGNRIPIDYNHLNVNFGESPTAYQAWMQRNYNHYELSEDVYNAVKDLKGFGKKVRIAGKVLLVAGVALDALELGITIDRDLKDADKKIGKQTLSTAASIGGSWAGAALGAKAGAFLGGLTGPAAPIAIPVLGLIGGVGGALGGDALGKWIVDITCTED